jgi:hypothetical protein
MVTVLFSRYSTQWYSPLKTLTGLSVALTCTVVAGCGAVVTAGVPVVVVIVVVTCWLATGGADWPGLEHPAKNTTSTKRRSVILPDCENFIVYPFFLQAVYSGHLESPGGSYWVRRNPLEGSPFLKCCNYTVKAVCTRHFSRWTYMISRKKHKVKE